MLTVRDAIPKARELATAEFATLRLRLLKIAARVVETTRRIRLAFAAAYPEADLFPQLARRAAPARPVTDRACARSPALFLQRVQNSLMHNPVKKPDGHPGPHPVSTGQVA